MPRLIALVAVLLFASTVAAQTGGDAPAADDPLEHELALLDALDDARVAVDWNSTPLGTALADLARQGVPVHGDWEALRSIGVRDHDEVTLTASMESAGRVIDALLVQLGDEYDRPILEARGASVLVTTIAAAGTLRRTDAYDVRDVLPAGEAEGTPPGDDPDGARSAEAQRVLRLLVDHVDPEAWVEFGGSRSRIDVADGALVVTAAPSVHRKLRRALARLRAANPTGVQVRATVLELPASAARALIAQSSGPTDASLRRAVRRNPDVATRWHAATVTAIGRRGVRRSEGEPATELTVAPILDDANGGLVVEIAFDDGAGRIEASLPVPAHRGGAVLELTTAPDAPTARLLVVEIERY